MKRRIILLRFPGHALIPSPLVRGRYCWNKFWRRRKSSYRSDGHLLEFESILTALSHLPPREDTDLAKSTRASTRKRSHQAPSDGTLIEGSEVVETL